MGKRHGNTARADDAGLFARNFGDGAAQILLVVESYIPDHADARLDDVGRIEASSHTDFEDRDFDWNFGEMLEGNGGNHLEKAGMPWKFAFGDEILSSPFDAVVQAGEIIVSDGGAVHANPFVNADQMRRGVETDAISGHLQDGSEGGSRRAFAVGSRDQHRGELGLRAA